MPYVLFIIRCVLTKFKFFRLSPLKKARFLRDCGLYFFAGKYYYKARYYLEAIDCYQKGQAHRHLLYAYEKIGLTSDALETACTYALYQDGAKIALRHHDYEKAAYFYYYFDVPQAVKLYKKSQDYVALGHCYLKCHRQKKAYESYLLCPSIEDRTQGFRALEEYAIVLYFKHRFQEAMTIFGWLDDSYSVRICAGHLKDESTYARATRRLAEETLGLGKTKEAIALITKQDAQAKRLYLYLDHLEEPSLTKAFGEHDYYPLLQYAFRTNNLHLAHTLKTYWLRGTEIPQSA